MESQLTQLGVGAIFVLLVLDRVFGFLKTRRNGSSAIAEKRMDTLCHQVDQLYDWHNVKDSDGIPLWYVRRSLEDSLKSLAKNIDTQTQVLREMLQESRAARQAER